MKNNHFNHDLAALWEEIQHKLDPLVEKTGYYVFQSKKIYHKPELLIVGLNPGGDHEEIKSLYNPCVKETNWYAEFAGKDDDGFASRLGDVFGYPEGPLSDLLTNAVTMNLIFINTGNQDKLEMHQNSQAIKSTCSEYSKKLIDLIAPKKILTLGNDPFFSLVGNSTKNWAPVELETNINIKKGHHKHTVCYWLPNPSRRNDRLYTEQHLLAYRKFLEKELLA